MILFGVGIVVDSILTIYFALRVLYPATGSKVLVGAPVNPELDANS